MTYQFTSFMIYRNFYADDIAMVIILLLWTDNYFICKSYAYHALKSASALQHWKQFVHITAI